MCNYVKKCLTWAISIVTVGFTFIPESVFKCFKLFKSASNEVNIIANRIIVFFAVILATLIVYALYLCFRKSVKIKGKNYFIQISYGDILTKTDCKVVIPFDECYTTDVGKEPHKIKSTSICGQYLTQNPIINIQNLIDSANVKPMQRKSDYNGQVRYESGTIVPNGNFLLMAFAKLDKNGLGRISYDEYIICLSKLWQEINKHYNQTDVCIPILGSGITRLDNTSLTQQELLDIIIASYKLSANKIKSTRTLHIICKKCTGFSLNKIGNYI